MISVFLYLGKLPLHAKQMSLLPQAMISCEAFHFPYAVTHPPSRAWSIGQSGFSYMWKISQIVNADVHSFPYRWTFVVM